MHPVRLLQLSFVCAFCVQYGTVIAFAQQDPDEVLARLRDRDQQFDDVVLRYDLTRVETVNLRKVVFDELARIRDGMRTLPPEIRLPDFVRDVPPPVKVEFTANELMATQGSVVAFERPADERVSVVGPTTPEWESKKDVYLPLIGGRSRARWSNSENQVRSTTDGEALPYISVQTSEGAFAVVDQLRMSVEFSFGLGYGKRMLRATSVAQSESGELLLKGKIRVWMDDESDCELTIDKDFIVRDARITSNVKGTVHNFAISSLGTYTPSDALPPLASSGSFRCELVGVQKGDEFAPKGVIRKNLMLDLSEAGARLPSGEFERLTRFEVTEGTTVRNHSTGVTVSSPARDKLLKRTNRWRYWLFAANITFVVVIVVLLKYRFSRSTDKNLSGDDDVHSPGIRP